MPRWRRVLLFALLLGVSLWAALQWRTRTPVFAWSSPLRVLVVPLLAPDLRAENTSDVIQGFLDTSDEESFGIGGVKSWFETQYTNFTGEYGPVLHIDRRDPARIDRPPPASGSAHPGPLGRLLDERRLRDYFKDVTEMEALDDADVLMFVYLYAPVQTWPGLRGLA